jgi:N utilization substance protein B
MKFDPASRRKARHYALQALYQWQISRNALSDIETQFCTEFDFSGTDLEYFQTLLHEVPKHVGELEKLFAPLLDRELKDLTPIELTVLRMGTYELAHRIDVPYKVVINEAVALTKKFGATDGYKYINGVMDRLAQQVRTVEVAAEKR